MMGYGDLMNMIDEVQTSDEDDRESLKPLKLKQL